MKRPETPCRECMDRIEGCHSVCDRYKVYCFEHEQYKEIVRSERGNGNGVIHNKTWVARHGCVRK